MLDNNVWDTSHRTTINIVASLESNAYKQDQPRLKCKAEYQLEYQDRYRPECKACRATQGHVLVPTQVSITDPSTSIEVGLVFILPSAFISIYDTLVFRCSVSMLHQTIKN